MSTGHNSSPAWPRGPPFPLGIFLGFSLLLRRYVFWNFGLGIHSDGGNGKKDYIEASCTLKFYCDNLVICWRVRVMQPIYHRFYFLLIFYM